MWIQPMKIGLHAAATALGDGKVIGILGKYGSAIVQITGITTGVVTFQGTLDGTNYVNILAKNLTSGATGATAAADGIYIVPIIGINKFKAPITTATDVDITATAMFIPEVITV